MSDNFAHGNKVPPVSFAFVAHISSIMTSQFTFLECVFNSVPANGPYPSLQGIQVSDQNLISPYILYTLSVRRMRELRKPSSKGYCFDAPQSSHH